VALDVAKHRLARPSKRKEAHRRRNPDVHADHARAHAVLEIAYGCSALGVQARSVGETAGVDEFYGLIQVGGPDNAHDRPEYLLPGDGHLRRDRVKDARPKEKSVLPAFHCDVSAVQEEPCAFGHSLPDAAPDAFPGGRTDYRTHLRFRVEPVADDNLSGGGKELLFNLLVGFPYRNQD